MASVKVETGEFPSAVGAAPGYEVGQIVKKWAWAARDHSKNISWIIKAFEETEALRLWEISVDGFTYPDRDTFLQKEVLLDYDLTLEQINTLGALISTGKQKEAQKFMKARAKGFRERIEAGATQAQIAAEEGVTQGRVSQIISLRPNNNPKRNDRTLYLAPDPAAAAARIRERLGDAFANALKTAL